MTEEKSTGWYEFKECEFCKKEFKARRRSKWGESYRFCSKKCHTDLRNVPIKLFCSHCKKEYEVPKWKNEHKPDRKFCSDSCKIDEWRKSGKPDKRNFENKKHYHKSGYVYIWAPNHPATKGKSYKYLLEHRVVMEAKIGRYLEKGENVHHINGIRSDNNPENLELWAVSQPSGQRISDMKKEIEQLKEQIKQLKGDF